MSSLSHSKIMRGAGPSKVTWVLGPVGPALTCAGFYYDYPPLAGADRLLRVAVLTALGLVGAVATAVGSE